jgi:hypothetical protein
MIPIEKPSIASLTNDSTISHVPSSYLQFCSEIGPGKLGNFTLFGVTSFHKHFVADFRYQTAYLQQKFDKEEFKKAIQQVHSFPMDELIIFGKYLNKDGHWVAWRKRKTENVAQEEVYLVLDSEKSPPPRQLSDSFTHFLEGICNSTSIEDEINVEDVDDEDETHLEEDTQITFTPFSIPNPNVNLTVSQVVQPHTSVTTASTVSSMLQASVDKFDSVVVDEEEEKWNE